MKEDPLEELKKTLVGVLREHDVKKAALFGSIVRGEATDESDIDLLVEFEGRKSLLDLAGLKLDLQEIVRTYVKLINRFIRSSRNGYCMNKR